MKNLLFSIFLLVLGTTSYAQNRSPELFSVGSRSVSSAEFLHMYTKNQMNKKVDYSKPALNEYLDLYSLFKMKVSQAYDLHLDTIPSVSSEIESYRKQLAKNYLTNRSVTDKLVDEAYARKKKDVNVAHILISLKPNSSDTIFQKKTIDSIYRQIKNGKLSFERAAQSFSQDKQSAPYGGSIGYITALQVVYPFEDVAYRLKKGQISKPFRTVYGYHIVKKINERPARGKIQVAQIMTTVRKSAGDAGKIAARVRIDSAYKALKNGASFEEVEKKYNEDQYTKNSGGVMPVFGVGKMVSIYEDAAFSLKKEGDYSRVVETANGYHIIYLKKKIPLGSLEEEKKVLEKLVQRDGRIAVAQDAFTQELKGKLNYKEDRTALNQLINAIPDSNLRNGKFDPNNYRKMTKTIFSLDGTNFSQADFANYIKVYTRGRIYGEKQNAISTLLDSYSEKVLRDREENLLEEENPEYRKILQEYREGILIFELTKQKVWDKAPKDSVGLANFYAANKSQYMWKPAFTGQIYTLKDESYAKKLVKELNKPGKKTTSVIVKNVNGDGPQDKARVEEGKFEKSRFAEIKRPFAAGKYLPFFKNKDGSYTLVAVDEVYNTPTQKTLKEAKGYVISDYQDQLEKEWKQELKAKYPLKVNQREFKSMVK